MLREALFSGCLAAALVGCAAQQVKPGLLPPHVAVNPEPADPKSKQSVEDLEYWLTILNANVGVNLEKVMEVCSILELQLHYRNSDNDLNWFQCGGDEGYTVAVNTEGKSVYVADSNFPGFNIDTLTQAFGPTRPARDGGMTVYMWTVAVKNGTQNRTLSLVIPDYKESYSPFVAIQLLTGE